MADTRMGDAGRRFQRRKLDETKAALALLPFDVNVSDSLATTTIAITGPAPKRRTVHVPISIADQSQLRTRGTISKATSVYWRPRYRQR